MWYKFAIGQQFTNYNDLSRNINNPYAPNIGMLDDEKNEDVYSRIDENYKPAKSPLEKSIEDSKQKINPIVNNMYNKSIREYGIDPADKDAQLNTTINDSLSRARTNETPLGESEPDNGVAEDSRAPSDMNTWMPERKRQGEFKGSQFHIPMNQSSTVSYAL